MKRIKVGIALITLFSLLLGTVGIASAKTATHTVKTSHIVTQHLAKKQYVKKSVHKSVKSQAKKSSKHTTKHV